MATELSPTSLPQAGVEDIGAGMSVCWFDYDNDGARRPLRREHVDGRRGAYLDAEQLQEGRHPEARALYHKHAMGNSLFRNGGTTPAFRRHDRSAGVGIGRWAWSSDAWDFDHDGFPDLYITNGMVDRSRPARTSTASSGGRSLPFRRRRPRPSHDYEQGWSAINELIRADGTWSGNERNIFYANNGDGTFSDISGVIGVDFVEDGRAFALADFDHDGRQEVFLKNRNARNCEF